jgi:hypothetical protein
MAWTGDQKRAARAALTALYPDAARACGLLAAAGLDPASFPFGGRALEVWAAPVDELSRRGRLSAVILHACEEHPDDPALRALRHAAAPAVQLTDPAPMYLSAAPGALHSGRPLVTVSLRPSKRS